MSDLRGLKLLLILGASALIGASAVASDSQPPPDDHMVLKHHHRKQSIRYDGLGPVPGKKSARLFADSVLSFPELIERVVTIHPSGKELFYMIVGPQGPQIMQSFYRDGEWQPPALAPFSNEGFNLEPSISPDGSTVFFISSRAPSRASDIWASKRVGTTWGEPFRLSDTVNSEGYEWHPQVTTNGDLYFAAFDKSDSYGDADLYVAKFENGEYLPPENLGPTVNSSSADWDGYVSPRGDYLIFKSNRPGGYGGMDMYISWRIRGAWSEPRNLGPVINTIDDEDAGDVTPDGCYLIFARSSPRAEFWTMYWIAMDAVRPQMTHSKCGKASRRF